MSGALKLSIGLIGTGVTRGPGLADPSGHWRRLPTPSGG